MWKVGIALLFSATLTLAACSPTRTAPTGIAAERDGVQFEQLADQVWMHTSYQDVPPWGPVRSNGLIVIDGSSSILVDTAWNDVQTLAILDWAESDLQRPVTRAVVTHAHRDKMGGMAALEGQAVATYAHPLSNRLARQRNLLPAGQELALAAPGDAVDFGPLHILYPGPAHSHDNIVVYVMDTGILFGGCLIRPTGARSLGNTADADVDYWDDAAVQVSTRFPSARLVVPSHGSPAGPELLELTARLAREQQAADIDAGP